MLPRKILKQKEKAAEASGLPAAATGTKTMQRKVQSKKTAATKRRIAKRFSGGRRFARL